MDSTSTHENNSKQRVLVLCTGNSCRSIMAEALINHLGAGKAQSAGSAPTGTVHPLALATLARHGIAVNAPRSQSWDELAGSQFDVVLTVCNNAAQESCPYFAGAPSRLHWDIPDPAAARGTEAEIEAVFDQVFSQLRQSIEEQWL
ncbi:MAG: arsenate reductase ArsC [Gammaproteobacteria bacterium]|jgi:arsenate reductase|nr:arsenate reductase ArsC [Gammaproteobacteria bacterium]